MDAFPPHRDLKHAMQLAQGAVCRHQHAPPHHRADAQQPDLDLHERVAIRGDQRGVLFLQDLLRAALHPARLPPAGLHSPGTPHIVMLSRYLVNVGDKCVVSLVRKGPIVGALF